MASSPPPSSSSAAPESGPASAASPSHDEQLERLGDKMQSLAVGGQPPADDAPLTQPPEGPVSAPLTSPSSTPKSPSVQPTAVLTEEAAQAVVPQQPSTPGTPSAPAPASSPAPPPSSSPSTSTSTSPRTSAPPLIPRASAPPAPSGPSAGPGAGGAARRPPPAGGALKAGVRGSLGGPGAGGPLKMPPSLAAKMAAMTSRSSSASTPSGTPPSSTPVPSLRQPPSTSSPAPPVAPRPGAPSRPPAAPVPGGVSAPAGRVGSTGPLAGPGQRPAGGMAARRRGPGAGLTLAQMGASAEGPASGSASPAGGAVGGLAGRRGGGMRLPGSGSSPAGGDGQGEGERPKSAGQGQGQGGADGMGTPFSNFRKIVDPSGRLNFASKAILHADGVDFSSGASFKIKMDEFELMEELGKGNYGTVQKVLHRPTGVTMALKEIRLELDDSKLKTIITELDILHRATSPYIIDFYGAFFIESCVYYCMEYMDARSLDFFAGTDVPEDVLARVTASMVHGLKFLKDELKIMHRDVKPTNVLVNQKGYVKLCDFGVSGQLDRSIAKTNIGCQSYMAPERIKGESQGAPSSYTASSDVWSLGLSIIEAAIGHYPYPPETYQNVFAQLTAIVHGDPPALPETYSETARDFVAQCLIKQADKRPTYAQLLAHPWLAADAARGPTGVDMAGWVARALEYRKTHPKISQPALA
ncbi:hypothetical protein JCM10207_005897 [Rhodosporidiobolus poonsookiae]